MSRNESRTTLERAERCAKSRVPHPAFVGKLTTTERLAEHLGGVIGDAIAKLPADARPAEQARLRVLLRESPNAWASHARAMPGP